MNHEGLQLNGTLLSFLSVLMNVIWQKHKYIKAQHTVFNNCY